MELIPLDRPTGLDLTGRLFHVLGFLEWDGEIHSFEWIEWISLPKGIILQLYKRLEKTYRELQKKKKRKKKIALIRVGICKRLLLLHGNVRHVYARKSITWLWAKKESMQTNAQWKIFPSHPLYYYSVASDWHALKKPLWANVIFGSSLKTKPSNQGRRQWIFRTRQ